MKVLDFEKKVGIETFFTDFKGFGGKLRYKPQDFEVEEVSIFPKENKTGIHTIAIVTSTNWETNVLINRLSDYLHISRQRINFAGTKDKRAKTTQLMSFYKVEPEKIKDIKIKDVLIDKIYKSDKSVKVGNLIGNKFKVIVRDLDEDSNNELIKDYKSFFKKNPYFPNFFGIQRFGIVRPITHEVGKYIIKGDFKKAVMTYIANPIKGEQNFELREKLEKSHDFADALKSYPNSLNFEKAMLNKLVKNPDDFIGALNELPKNLLTMFIYAYQSYLFNKIISKRILKNISLNKAILGDLILPIKNGIIDENPIYVKKTNIDKVNLQISRSKAVVSGVLFGTDSIFSEGLMGEIEKDVIKEEKINYLDFIIPEMPRLSSKGTRRPIIAHIKNLKCKIRKDEILENKKVLELSFELNKGCYATSLLREFMKSNDIKNY
jgi:tRNA pseudouridine13 synthase